ncbi:MAG: hypothetical protein Q8N18_26020 [Opitutaceae bacterium]|nr:hypothetical protein [Opitutaceae bacterium]
MKTPFKIFPMTVLLLLLSFDGRAQIPVTDVANLAVNQASQSANLAKWVESINNLRTQIDQLNRQINIQDDIRRWSGNPVEAGAKVVLEGMGERDLVRDYGKTKSAILGLVGSLDSLKRTTNGNYRAISDLDLDGNELKRDPLTYRRYAVLDATQTNTEQVSGETKAREKELQTEIAITLEELRDAPTESETQKLSAKLTALNGQLAQVETARRREVDAVALQKIANDARLEQERLAAAELGSRDDYLANQRVSAYLKTLRVRKNPPGEK